LFDGGSEGFLEAIVEALPGTRWLVLLNFRPEYHAAWMQRSYSEQLPLLPLGPEAGSCCAIFSAEILQSLPLVTGFERGRAETRYSSRR
jgi:adenylate cyclase